MACTVAVEALVTQHYDSQLVALAGAGQPALEATIAQFREVLQLPSKQVCKHTLNALPFALNAFCFDCW